MENIDLVMLLSGSLLLVLAAISSVAERGRLRRKNMDRVGFMPWTSVFFFCFLAGIMLLGLGGRGWLSGS